MKINQLNIQWTYFKHICSFTRGVTYNKSNEVNKNSLNPWKVLRANNITQICNILNFNEIKYIDSNVKVSNNQRLYKNDILICAASGSKDHIGKLAYINENMNYIFGGFMGVIRSSSNIINSKYLFYILSSNIFKDYLNKSINNSTIKNISLSLINDFKIPVLPLKEQIKIINTLDVFTSLIYNLTKELDLRKQQYIYYRNKLFSFDSTVEYKYIDDVCFIITGGELPKNYIKSSTPKDNYIYPLYSNAIGEKSIWGYSDSYKINKEAVTISSVGTIGYPTLRKAYFTPIIRLKTLIPKLENNLNIKYLKYVLETINLNSNNSSLPNINSNMIKKIKIPVPNIHTQNNIVNTLDVFSEYINKLNKEIALRLKQYKYYREKLLTFN